jgi:hypothetical protein
MNRKLWLLNFLLLALAVLAGWQLRNRWVADKARAAAEAHRRVAPIPGPPFTAAPVPPAVLPAGYADIAQKDLFDRSRNPEVIVEKPPVPPPPPVPALPVYHGSMNFGDGPMAILSVNAGAPQQATRPGEMIGPFKLVDITREDLTLEWDGQTIRKPLDEITSHGATAQQTDAASAGRTDAPAAAVQARVEAPSAKGPGESTTFGFKTCVPNDNTPVGTVQDGFRKTQVQTPFGPACVWDPVGK